MMCMEVPVQSVVRHSKSVHESKTVEEIKSGVSKIQMHLLAAEESRSHETEGTASQVKCCKTLGTVYCCFWNVASKIS